MDLGFLRGGLITEAGGLEETLLNILFCGVQKCQDFEYLIEILNVCEKELTKVVPGGVVGATF